MTAKEYRSAEHIAVRLIERLRQTTVRKFLRFGRESLENRCKRDSVQGRPTLAKTEQDRAPFHKEQSPEPFIRKVGPSLTALPCSTTLFHLSSVTGQ
jgi:hypothetical protein